MSAQVVVHSLQVLEVVTPALHPSLRPELFSLLPLLLSCVCSPFTTIRHMAARCVAANTQVDLHRCMLVRLYMWSREAAPFFLKGGNSLILGTEESAHV